MKVYQGYVSARLRFALTITVIVVLALFAAVFFMVGISQPLAFDLALIIALTSFLLRLILDRAGQIRVVISARQLFFSAGAVESDQLLDVHGLDLQESPIDWQIKKAGKTLLCLKKRWFSAIDCRALADDLRRLFSESAETSGETRPLP